MRIYQVILVKKLFGERSTVGGRDGWPRSVAEMGGRDDWPKSQVRKFPHLVERNNQCPKMRKMSVSRPQRTTSSAGLGEPTGEHSIMATSAYVQRPTPFSMQIFTGVTDIKGLDILAVDIYVN